MTEKKSSRPNPSPRPLVDAVTFMRGRHPDQYSDSTFIRSNELTPALLGYHLDTLTNRTQENEFAYFARRLAEKEICPNLRPQTGPIGGGDSKVDSETIPVSSEISELWVGLDPKAATERWAFAFSAKKDWKSKVRNDVHSIVSTGRDYKRIYFITNQFAPDKSRSQSEDSLSKETGVEVKILDRSWVAKAVIENGRADIAIEALKIDELKPLVSSKLGPTDTQRKNDLEELENRITDPEYYRGARYQLLEDCLRVAMLARELGLPRTQVDGYFIRAANLADELNIHKQRLRIAYQYAWTVIFWFNDYQQLNKMYENVEQLALKSDQTEDVELALHLWMVICSEVSCGNLNKDAAKICNRKQALIDAFTALAGEKTRPNNALQARVCLTLIAANDAMTSGEVNAFKSIWLSFNEIVKEAKYLGDFPFERLANLLTEMGNLGIQSKEYDDAFESVVSIFENRRGEGDSARLLVEHGYRKLEGDLHYEAINIFGRALERLRKREYRDDLIYCMMGLCMGYEKAGLAWASRSCALAATERCMAYFREEGKILRLLLLCLRHLLRTEIFLGRIPHILMCVELSNALTSQMILNDKERELFSEEYKIAEFMLGLMMLTATLDQLSIMTKLPAVLEELGLFITKGFLLYALGQIDELRNEGFAAEEWSLTDIDDFFKNAYEQPERLQLPQLPQIDDGKTISYRTNVLGCEIILTGPASPQSMLVGETILAVIEAFFATSLNEKIMPFRSLTKIIVEPSTHCLQGLIVTLENSNSGSFVKVQHPAGQMAHTIEARSAYQDSLMELILKLIPHIAVMDDAKSYMDKIANEERGFSRSLIYSDAALSQENVFGRSPKMLIDDWQSEEVTKDYPLIRTETWSTGITFNQIPLSKQDNESAQQNNSDIISKRRNNTKHSDRKIISLIDIPLWDDAMWQGIMYADDPHLATYPVLGLAFKNWLAAEKIFESLQRLLGPQDESNILRITIITGIQRNNPAAYRVVIGTNFNFEDVTQMHSLAIARIHTMVPPTPENLNHFLRRFKTIRNCLVAPVRFIGTAIKVDDIGLNLAISKKEIIVRPAWEIGVHDIDLIGIHKHDDPIIPDEIKNAPITDLLKMKRDFSK